METLLTQLMRQFDWIFRLIYLSYDHLSDDLDKTFCSLLSSENDRVNHFHPLHMMVYNCHTVKQKEKIETSTMEV